MLATILVKFCLCVLMSIILANASRWHKTRTLRPKGKRKSAAKGGGRKRRRRYYNLKNLKNQKKCLCALRLVYDLIVNFNWQYTRAVHFTAVALNLAPRTVFKFSKDYMNGESKLPNDLVMKVRGRGAAAFIMNHGKDKYSLLKEVS